MGNDRGSISVAYAVFAVVMLAAVSIVVDGGRRMSAVAEARDISDNAARAGAQAIDLDVWRSTGDVQIDPTQANQNVAQFMASSNLDSRVTSTSVVVNGETVTVTVTVQVDPFGPGITSADVVGVGTADAIESVIGP